MNDNHATFSGGGYSVPCTVRPWRAWPGQMTVEPRNAPFKASWSKTIALLARELYQIGARDVIVELNVNERDIRNDGWIRSTARPITQGVIISFTSKKTGGAVRFPCDAFDDWQDNVRAIALGLEALRKVDRYGITQRHEQFAGYRALPSTTGTTMSVQAARAVIAKHSGYKVEALQGDDEDRIRTAVRSAIHQTHPDRNGGDRTQYDVVETAKRVLVAHHGVAL
jgi:hypothetical protein